MDLRAVSAAAGRPLFFVLTAAALSVVQVIAAAGTYSVLHCQLLSLVRFRHRAGAMVMILYPVASSSVERS